MKLAFSIDTGHDPMSKKDKKKKKSKRDGFTPLNELSPFADDGLYNVVIETPKGSPNKLGYDPELGAFKLNAVMPQGSSFPFDFGFIPGTRGGDGDPVDVLVLMDYPLTPGSIVEARLIGVISADQTEKNGEVEENDRVIAVSPESSLYQHARELSDIPEEVVDQVQQFFVNYNEQRGKKFEPTGQHGPDRAEETVARARKTFKRSER
jgi:inorganic pyrophosphatase